MMQCKSDHPTSYARNVDRMIVFTIDDVKYEDDANYKLNLST